jgi:hypothetical protein
MAASNPFPSSVVPCMGRVDCLPLRNTFKCEPLPGRKVAPCCSNHFLNCLEFIITEVLCFLSAPALRRSLACALHVTHTEVTDGQDAANIRRLYAQRCGAEGEALRGASNGHVVALPVNLQHAGGYIGCQRVAAVGAGGAFKPVRGLQQGCACLCALASRHQALVAGPRQGGK